MDHEQFNKLLEQCPHQIKRFKTDAYATLQNDVCDKLTIPTKGHIQTQMIDSFGKQIWMEIMQAYQPILANFLKIISNRSKFLSDHMKFHAFKPLRSKQEMADRSGVTR